MSSHSFWTLSIGEGVMGFSVVTRSCRALRAEKLPITRVVSSLVSISLSNKGVGLRNHQKLRGKYLSIPATKKSSSESFCNCFSWSTQNSTSLGREGSRIGRRSGQSRQPLCQPRNSQTYLPHPLAPSPWWLSVTGRLAGVDCFSSVEPS